MTNVKQQQLTPDEIEVGRGIWHDLKKGAPNAHDQLNAAPAHIHQAILFDLSLALAARNTALSRFE